MHAVKEAKYLHDYQLQITFDNNKTKLVDLFEILKNAKGVFLPLKELNFFKKFKVDPESETIIWPNVADIAPEYLYEHGTLLRKKDII